jgi:allophanate hydrolase
MDKSRSGNTAAFVFLGARVQPSNNFGAPSAPHSQPNDPGIDENGDANLRSAWRKNRFRFKQRTFSCRSRPTSVHNRTGMTLSDLSLDIESLHDGYRTGSFSPIDVIKEVYRRNSTFGDNPIWITLVPEHEALHRVEHSDPAKPLYGIPFAVKDNIDIADLTTTAGCPSFAYIAGASATVVEKLLAAGAILIGKTNLDQFATGLVGTRSPYGVCHSVFDSAHISGGSSSGSALAVAGGLVSFALGTDTAGSGRVPAALNQIVGLKPTCGVFSGFGVVPACRSLDCVSVFSLTIDDAESVFNVACGDDPKDPYSRGSNKPVALSSNPKIGTLVQRELIDEKFQPLYEEAVSRFEALGYSTIPIDVTPFLAAAKLLYGGPWVAERFASVGSFIKSNPEVAHPVVRQIILGGEKFTAAEAFEGQYQLKRLRQKTRPIWGEIDVLLLPTTPTTFLIDEVLSDPIGTNTRLGIFTNFVNLLDLAAVAVPAGQSIDRLPFGVTLIGPAFSDIALLQLAQKYNADLKPTMGGTGHPYPLSRRKDSSAAMNRTHLAVVGAHLSGLPLNYQLTDRGAHLVETTTTAPDYRLYALPNTTPPKPGLVRTAPADGAKIEVEIWELSMEAFGEFVNEIPSPLGIGTLRLADGRSVKGFLCESIAVEGAKDVSSLGGWRKVI